MISASRSGVHIGNMRLLWWVDRSTIGEWWTIHVTLHRYGIEPK